MAKQQKFKSSGGGSGAVDSVVAGTGISVDNTDPANPIVNNLAPAPIYSTTLIPFGDNSTPGGITFPGFSFDEDIFTVEATPGGSSGWGNIQAVIASSGSEAGISLQNSGTGGSTWNLISTATSSGIGGGMLSIGNSTTSKNYINLDVTELITIGVNGTGLFYAGAGSAGLTGTEIGVAIDIFNNIYYFGNPNGSNMTFDGAGAMNIKLISNDYFSLNTIDKTYKIGDIDNIDNGTLFIVNDAGNRFGFTGSSILEIGGKPIDYSAANSAGFWKNDGFGVISYVNGALPAAQSGWGTPTGTLYRTALTDSSTQGQFNQALQAVITDLKAAGILTT